MAYYLLANNLTMEIGNSLKNYPRTQKDPDQSSVPLIDPEF